MGIRDDSVAHSRDKRHENTHFKDKIPKSYRENRSENKKDEITPETIIERVLSNKASTYLPPSKLRLLQSQITDKKSVAYQRMNWMGLKKKINGLINKVNISNVQDIALNLLEFNIIRGRGVVVQSLMRAQVLSTVFTNVYASLLAIINSKFPQIGELLVKRLVVLFRKAFKRNDKDVSLSSIKFIAHLINQRVAHEILALDILTILLENPTDDSIEVAIGFLKECGMKMKEIAPQGLRLISDQLRTILHESLIVDRTQMLIDTYFQIYKDNFKDYPSIIEELNLIDEQDQFTHMVTLDEEIDTQDLLNVFKHDKNFEDAEAKYEEIKKEILPNSDEENESGESDGEDNGDSGDENKVILDSTETNIIAFRRTVYLTIHSSLSHDECAHKLLKMDIKPGLEEELVAMILDCCAQERTYKKFYGLLAERFCKIDQKYQDLNEKIFSQAYNTVHRLEGIKIKNMSKFFSHLLDSDAISWKCFECVQITNPDTTSSSRIFIKCIFQELAEFMGMEKLKERLSDPFLETSYMGLFPKDDPQNTIMAINFFTTIGLGPLTEDLRQHLATVKEEQKRLNEAKEQEMLVQAAALQALASDDENDSSDSSSTSSSSEPDVKKLKGSSEINYPRKKQIVEIKINDRTKQKINDRGLKQQTPSSKGTKRDRESRKDDDDKWHKNDDYDKWHKNEDDKWLKNDDELLASIDNPPRKKHRTEPKIDDRIRQHKQHTPPAKLVAKRGGGGGPHESGKNNDVDKSRDKSRRHHDEKINKFTTTSTEDKNIKKLKIDKIKIHESKSKTEKKKDVRNDEKEYKSAKKSVTEKEKKKSSRKKSGEKHHKSSKKRKH